MVILLENMWERIPELGNVMDFLSSSIGFLVVIVLPMLVVLHLPDLSSDHDQHPSKTCHCGRELPKNEAAAAEEKRRKDRCAQAGYWRKQRRMKEEAERLKAQEAGEGS